jgi:hypothetical protein
MSDLCRQSRIRHRPIGQLTLPVQGVGCGREGDLTAKINRVDWWGTASHPPGGPSTSVRYRVGGPNRTIVTCQLNSGRSTAKHPLARMSGEGPSPQIGQVCQTGRKQGKMGVLPKRPILVRIRTWWADWCQNCSIRANQYAVGEGLLIVCVECGTRTYLDELTEHRPE